MKTITRAASLFAAFFTPALALATGYDARMVAINLISIINGVLVPLIFAVAFIVFLYGVMKKYVLSSGDSTGVEEGHKLILWGIIGFVVMISLWGIVNIVSNTFLLQGLPPSLPYSPGGVQTQTQAPVGSAQNPAPLDDITKYGTGN